MTEKEKIIIDGVDVSGCEYHYCDKDGEHRCFESDQTCQCTATCNFGAIYLREQLARKTQECEELRALVANSKFAEFVLGECELNFPIMQKYANAFKDIKEEVSALHCSTCVFHKGTTHELADRIQKTYIKVLEIITSVEGEQK